LGYLPIDKADADLPFQIISHRYESGSFIITTNSALNRPSRTARKSSTTRAPHIGLSRTAAAPRGTVVIKGQSYRIKEILEK
jgi:DNA replication protein DnaC